MPRRAFAGLMLGVTFLALGASPAASQTMQFGATACGGGGYLSWGSTFSEAGFSLSTPGGFGFANWCSANTHYAGSPALFINTTASTATLTRTGGGAFSIQSIDLAKIYSTGTAGAATFTGVLAPGGTVTTTFGFSSALSFSTFAFDDSWDNVTSVSWAQSANFFSGEQFTNIVLGDAVVPIPEPATSVLLMSGLLGVLAASRRRAHKRRGLRD